MKTLMVLGAKEVEAVWFKCPKCKGYEWRVSKEKQWAAQPGVCPECGVRYANNEQRGKPNIFAASDDARKLLRQLRTGRFTIEIRRGGADAREGSDA